MADYIIAFFQYTIKVGEAFFYYHANAIAALNIGFWPTLSLFYIAIVTDNGIPFYTITKNKLTQSSEEYRAIKYKLGTNQ